MKKRINKKLFIGSFLIIIALFITAFALNIYVKNYSDDFIIEYENLKDYSPDCIIVLGAGLKKDGTPNNMLKDRLDMGIFLYNEGKAPKLLLSGDNGQVEYDEVNAMKEYAMINGVPPEDIFMDHAGFSTYESMYRAKEIFGVKKP